MCLTKFASLSGSLWICRNSGPFFSLAVMSGSEMIKPERDVFFVSHSLFGF